MQEFVTVTGIIIKSENIGEYDRRIVILTKERGKIAAFAKGSRKPTSMLLAATSPFSYGEFKMYEGRTSYNLMEVNIQNYFEALREDFEGAYYGMYFRSIFEIRAVAAGGEFPGVPIGERLQESTIYAIEHIAFSPIEKLYTFTVSDEVLEELKKAAKKYQGRFTDRKFKSLEIIDNL